MAAIVTSVDVDRSPEEVFAYIADLARQVEWQEDLVSVTVETEGPTRVGTRAVYRRKLGPRVMATTAEIAALDPPRLISFRSVGGPIDVRGSERVEPTEAGSRVTFEMELGARGLGALMLPIVRRQASRRVVTDHERLKRILESGTG